jgi:hypothetical protein
MLNFLLFLVVGSSVCKGFQLTNYNKIINIYPCTYISDKLWYTTKEAVDATNKLNYFKLQLHTSPLLSDYGTNTICNTTDRSGTYFKTTSYSEEIDIKINNALLITTNSLYNVILHELGHVMGLYHTPTLGVMNYTVRTIIERTLFFHRQSTEDIYNLDFEEDAIIVDVPKPKFDPPFPTSEPVYTYPSEMRRTIFVEDERKLWWSPDDVKDIAQSYREIKKKYCTKSSMYNFIEFYRCMYTYWNQYSVLSRSDLP